MSSLTGYKRVMAYLNFLFCTEREDYGYSVRDRDVLNTPLLI